MSKIRIHFDDLCTFFTKYPERLMVGMMPTEGDGAEHRHEPHIVIRQGGVVVWEYRALTKFTAIFRCASLRKRSG